MASESIYAPKNFNKPAIEIDNDSKIEKIDGLSGRPHPLLNRPVLHISDVEASLTDRDLANGIFNLFIPVRLKIDRGPLPHEGKMAKGTVEFQTVEKAEQAHATISNPRLSFNEDAEMDRKPSAKPRLVNQLPSQIENVEIFDIFRPYGPIASAQRLMTNSQGQHTGFRGMAMVVFYDEEDAQRAEADLHCAEVEGKTISVSIDTIANRPAQSTLAFSATATPFVPGISSSSSSHHMNAAAPAFRPLRQDSYSLSSPTLDYSNAANIDPCNLFCKNLDSSIDSTYLSIIFRPFGSIVSARVMRDDRGVSKGFGFVSFSTADEAARALQAMDKSVQGSKQMIVRLHEPKKIRHEKLSQKYGNAFTESSGVEPLETPSEGISDSEGLTSSLDGRSPVIRGYFPSTDLRNGESAELDRLQSMPSKDRKAEITNRLTEEIKQLPDVEMEAIDQLVRQLCKLTLPDAVRLFHHPERLLSAIKEIQSIGHLDADSALRDHVTSTPPKLSEQQRLQEAILPLLSLDAPMEEIVDLLMELPSKERAMSLFNQEYLRRKVDEAKMILEMSDDEGKRQDKHSIPVQLTRENIELATASPQISNENFNGNSLKASYTITELAAFPAAEIVRLINTSTASSLPLSKADPSIAKETNSFIDSIQDLSLTDQKQKLGDQVFKKVKSFGVKGAPKITIALLDNEDLRSLAHLMNSYPDCLREKIEQGSPDDLPPITPVNRLFTAVDDTDSFFTAIQSPNSDIVIAARARARSRSDVPPVSSVLGAIGSTIIATSKRYADSSSPEENEASKIISNIGDPSMSITEQKQSPILTVTQATLFESPSLNRRSRLFSSNGVALPIIDSFKPLTLQEDKTGEEQGKALLGSSKSTLLQVSARPRASTLSIPSPSRYLPNIEELLFDQPKAYNGRSGTIKEISSDQKEEGHNARRTTTLEDLSGDLVDSSCTTQREIHHESSFETSTEVSEATLSTLMSNSFTESNDSTHESFSLTQDSTDWRDYNKDREDDHFDEHYKLPIHLTGASSTISAATHSTVSFITSTEHQYGRPKSHTISDIGLTAFTSSSNLESDSSHCNPHDVFGPMHELRGTDAGAVYAGTDDDCEDTSGLLKANLAVKENAKPRRLTVGGPPPSMYRKQSTRATFHHQDKPELINTSLSPPLSRTRTQSAAVPSALQDAVTEDQSLTAFQELIDGMKRERPVQSKVIEEVHRAEPRSIGAVLEYRSCSPSSYNVVENEAKKCELCGSMALRLTMLEPCGHFACATCCSSGLNQVTATPPRAHTCASCHSPVVGIKLRPASTNKKDQLIHKRQGARQGNRSGGLVSSPKTLDVVYRSMASSSPTKNMPAARKSAIQMNKTQGGKTMGAVDSGANSIQMMSGNITSSSDLFTEDQSFYQSHRMMQQQQESLRNPVTPTLKKETMSSAKNERVVHRQDSISSPNRDTTAQGTTIVRADNIPWIVAYKDVIDWIPPPCYDILPDSDVSPSAVHMPIDFATGKSSNCCFIECKNKEAAMKLVRHRNNSRLLGRPVSLVVTTVTDLLDEVFPARLESTSMENEKCLFFTSLQLQQLVDLLRNGGIQLKGPLKIIDMVTSMIRLVPADLSRMLSEMLFRRAREIVCICIAANQETPSIRPSLDRLLLACSNCACFSVSQRIEILDSARGTLTALTQVKEVTVPVEVIRPNPAMNTAGPSMATINPYFQEYNQMEIHKLTNAAAAEAAQAEYQAFLHQASTPMPLPLQHTPPRRSGYAVSDNINTTMTQWPLASPFVEKSSMPVSLMQQQMEVLRRQRIGNCSADQHYRQLAMQTLLGYGIQPNKNVEAFDKMINELAVALAKQQLIK